MVVAGDWDGAFLLVQVRASGAQAPAGQALPVECDFSQYGRFAALVE
jgi:hypothetical protein